MHIAYFIIVLGFAIQASAFMPAREKYPQVIAHRGASGYLPEHSLQAYDVAIQLGAGPNYVEPDLCLSKDGVFVAMHDLLLDETTNVAEFAQYVERYTTKFVDGANMTGYFVSDFTLEELKSLSLKQRVATRSVVFNGLFQIPSFAEVMAMMQQQYTSSGKMIGIYPELKHPSYHHSIGFEMEDMLLESLTSGGYAISGEFAYNDLNHVVPVIIQCFESESLKYLQSKSSLPLMLLIKYSVNGLDFISDAMLEETSKFASAIGPEKKFFDPVDIKRAKEFLAKSKELHLSVHPWTFRADSGIIPPFDPNFAAEERYFYGCLGVDAVFTEFPDQTRETVDDVTRSILSRDSFCLK